MLNSVTQGYCLSSSFLAILEVHLPLSLFRLFLCHKLTFSCGDDLNHITHYTESSSHAHTPNRRNLGSDFWRNICHSMLSKNGTTAVNPVWSMQNLRYQGGLTSVLSGMHRMRAWNQIGKINNKSASPKIFHLLSLLLCFIRTLYLSPRSKAGPSSGQFSGGSE